MNDYQSSRLADILPPPPLPQPPYSILLWLCVVILLALAIVIAVLRSRRFARFRLQRKIKRSAINPRQAVNAVMQLASSPDDNWRQRAQQLRFGPGQPTPDQLLELLRDAT